jgi:ABC-type transport system substrate-binding protein
VNRQSRFLLVAVIVLGLSALFWWNDRTPRAPRPQQSQPAPLERGGTLVASLRSEPRSYNRLVSRDFATEVVTLLTQARLVRVNRATQLVEPWLAEQWTSSPDGLVHTLTLREGLHWSDGTPFTSADVSFTFDAVYDPASKSVLASGLEIDGEPLAVPAPCRSPIRGHSVRGFGCSTTW